MDKEQATDYILNRLKLGDEKVIIAQDLSQRMNAPENIIIRFVNQVANIHNNELSAPQLGPDPAPNSSGSMTVLEPRVDEPTHKMVSPDNDLIPSDLDSSTSEGRPTTDTRPPTPKAVDKAALSSFVLESIKKQSRHNDIVEEVCTRTGWSWNDSQRFVARTQTKNHAKIAKSKKAFLVPFSIGFIFCGGLLLIWSAIALIDYYQSLSHGRYSSLPSDFIPLVIGALLASFGIITGGIVGLYRTLFHP